MRLLVPDQFLHVLRTANAGELGNLRDDLLKLRGSGLGRERILDKAAEAGWDRAFTGWYVDALNEHGLELEIEVPELPAPPPIVEVHQAIAVEPGPTTRWTAWRKIDSVLGVLIFILGIIAFIPATQQPLDNVRAMLLVIVLAFFALTGLLVAFAGAIGHVLWVLLAIAMFGMMMMPTDSPSSSNSSNGIPIYILGAYGLGRLFPARRAVTGWILGGVFAVACIGFAISLDSSKREDNPKEEVVASLPVITPHDEAREYVDVRGTVIFTKNVGSPTHDSVRKLVAWVNREGDRQDREEKELSPNNYKRLFDTKLMVTKKGRQEVKSISTKFRQLIQDWDVKASTEELNSLMVEVGSKPLIVKEEFTQAHLARNEHFLKMLGSYDQMLNIVSAGRVTVDRSGKLIFHSNQFSKYQRSVSQFGKHFEAATSEQERVERVRLKFLEEFRAFVDAP